MKLLKILLPAFLFLSIVLVAVTHYFQKDPDAPKFLRTNSAPPGLITNLPLDFAEMNTFQDGYLLFSTALTSESHHGYLFNMDRRQIVGEMLVKNYFGTHGFNADQSKLICEQFGGSMADSLQGKIAGYISRVTSGKINFQDSNCFVNLWMLDLQNGSARKIAKIEQLYFVTGGAQWHFATGHHRAFRYDSSMAGEIPGLKKMIFHVIDLETVEVQEFSVEGRPLGWWNDRQIMIRNHDDNFVLLDTITRKTNIFLSCKTISEFLVQNHLTEANTNVLWARCVTHSGQNDFYLEGFKDFFCKINRTGPSLELLSEKYRNVLLQKNNLDSTLTYNVDMLPGIFEDTPSREGPWPPEPHGGVFLHNLAKSTTMTLVPDGPARSYSNPKFYHDRIIYEQDHAIWQMDMNGSNKVQLFPPPAR